MLMMIIYTLCITILLRIHSSINIVIVVSVRIQTNTLANLSLNDSIWSNTHASKRPEEKRNFNIKVGGELNSINPSSNSKQINESDFNSIWSNSYASSKILEEE
ncbi:hypothetical protein CsSME_00044050 [Camellia sinensis var. sinensis]